MFKMLVIGSVAIALVTGMICSPEQEQEDTKKTRSAFMQRKLVDSRDIVSGLATEDFDLITKKAQDLMLLSQEADWKVITTPEYLRLGNDFRSSAERLRESGRSRNLDGATLAYFEVTLNCVRCHKYIRKEKNNSEPMQNKRP